MLMKKLFLLCFLLFPLSAAADNYATCLLDNLEGVQNDVAAVSAVHLCSQEYPGRMGGVEWGSGRGWFADYDSVNECSLESTRSMQSKRAALQARAACTRLYGYEPPKRTSLKPFDGDFTPLEK